LGEVKEDLIPRINEDLNIVGSIIEPFMLVPGTFGVFPHRQRPRVLWLGLQGNINSLIQAHLLLGKRFDLHHGLAYDRKAYRPHVTLARGPQCKEPELELWNQMYLEEHPPHWQVTHIHLYRSELRPEGAVHTILHSAPLTSLTEG
jgi:2'-5' RNA ligase